MIAHEFAHYRVHDRIGQGGMGDVYLADDLALDSLDPDGNPHSRRERDNDPVSAFSE